MARAGIFFEIVAGDQHDAKAEFPHSLGPFAAVTTSGLRPSDLSIQWGAPATWATQEHEASLPRTALRNPETSSLRDQLPEKVTLTVSPLHPLNLPESDRQAAGIPVNAEHFVFSYPCAVDVDVLADDADSWFLAVGGFIYFDARLNALRLNALVKNTTGGLRFGAPKDWLTGWEELLQEKGRTFHPVTMAALTDHGVSHFTWVPPHTMVAGQSICPLGGFAYLFGDNPKAKTLVAAPPLSKRTFMDSTNPKNNIMLMTDGYKFSHHKQFPVSWVPQHARPAQGGLPPVLFPANGSLKGAKIEKLARVPGDGELKKITIITNVSTTVVEVEPVEAESPDVRFSGRPVTYTGAPKSTVILALSREVHAMLGLPKGWDTVKFANVDETKLKRGSPLNANFEGGYNVSYFTPRAYGDKFGDLAEQGGGDHVCFFGLQYLVKEYMTGTDVITEDKVEEAEAFIARFMADVRVQGSGGYDYTMFPRGDWKAMATGDYDGTGTPVPERAGVLPIKIESLPEGSLLAPGVCCFKLTNTHPRFYWLPNFLETLLVQVWYPMTVATQTREFRKTIQAYSVLSQRVSQIPEAAGLGPAEFTIDNVVNDGLAVHIAQVFDLLDFGYRGVSSHETAALGSASYYVAGFEGSDTVAGSRMALSVYDGFRPVFEDGHGATSIPAAEHSTITSWADMSPDSDPVQYEKDEYCAFANMFKQYSPAFGVSLVSDGFNIWNAVCNHWTSDVQPDAFGGMSMRAMLNERLKRGQLSIIRPDSGEGVETLPQLLTLLHEGLPEHWVAASDLAQMTDVFDASDARAEKYEALVSKIRAKTGLEGNPFRCFNGQQMRVLQGDGIALDTVGDMLASLLANGFCANTVHFGSGGGLLQKIDRDSLSCAFKCCAMYVGDDVFAIGKDPIAGGKKSYAGNPCVIRGSDGVLRNRGEYDATGKMIRSKPMTVEEFRSEAGVEGDELRTVFVNGVMQSDVNSWSEIQKRAKVTTRHLDAAVTKALDNLSEKIDFLQRMSAPRAIAVRLAEASVGAKWMHSRTSKLSQMKSKFPAFASEFDAIGITESMESDAILAHLKSAITCDKKTAKRVLAALADGDVAEACHKMGEKVVLTL
jgi:nicotinamide phosphoribosyltransferase